MFIPRTFRANRHYCYSFVIHRSILRRGSFRIRGHERQLTAVINPLTDDCSEPIVVVDFFSFTLRELLQVSPIRIYRMLLGNLEIYFIGRSTGLWLVFFFFLERRKRGKDFLKFAIGNLVVGRFVFF